MQARALICDSRQHFSLESVTLRDPAPDQIAIRTRWSGVSIGTEFALIRNKISWGPYPLCTGYMGTGVVEGVGAEVGNFKVGDRVYFRGNDSMVLGDGQPVSCVSGAHCSHVVLRPNTSHGADLVPEGAPMDVAAMFVMPSVGLHGVDLANPRAGQTVVVYGVGLIGLGVVTACVHRGCAVVAVDVHERQLALARELGADHCLNAAEQDLVSELSRIAPGGADVVFEATGLPQCLDAAISLCRPFGTFVWQGNYGAAPVSLQFLPAHGRQLTMVFPCDDGLQPCRRAVLRNIAMGALRWEKTITHRIHYTEAPEAYQRINTGQAPEMVGVVVRWDE
ncbi:MAG TPA: zinc-binding alcohol dehydrogenase [Armatimonadota bacterium]|jgi:2-desacetyl-2-hydroxyethyl bacteriochlorophyllide A dehydrogenase